MRYYSASGPQGSEEIRPGWHFAGQRLTVAIPAALGYDSLRLHNISRTLAQHLPRHWFGIFPQLDIIRTEIQNLSFANLTCCKMLQLKRREKEDICIDSKVCCK